jgi:hypothetical protein
VYTSDKTRLNATGRPNFKKISVGFPQNKERAKGVGMGRWEDIKVRERRGDEKEERMIEKVDV